MNKNVRREAGAWERGKGRREKGEGRPDLGHGAKVHASLTGTGRIRILRRIVLMFVLLGFGMSVALAQEPTVGDYQSVNSGNWSDLANWQRYTLTGWETPTIDQGYPGQNAGTDDVTIQDGHTVTIDVSPENAVGSVLIGAPAILQYEATNARTLRVSDIIRINRGGTFRSALTGTVATHQLIADAGIVNEGTLNFSTNNNTAGVGITFSGNSYGLFDLSGATLTNLMASNGLILNKGANVLSFTPGGDFQVLSGNIWGFLTIQSGTFSMMGENEFRNPLFYAFTGSYTIPPGGGFRLDNPNATIVGMDGTLTNDGEVIISDGIYNIGIGSGNELHTTGTGRFVMIGGTLNISGRFRTSDGDCFISGGRINLATIGHADRTLAAFYASPSADLTINGINGDPLITFAHPNSNGTPYNDIEILAGEGNKTITGGTFQMGAPAIPATTIRTFLINSEIPVHNLVIYNRYTRVSLTGDLAINNQLTLNGRLLMNNYSLGIGAPAIVGTFDDNQGMIVTGYGTGEVRKRINAIGNYLFPVGTESGTTAYLPVTLNVTAGTFTPGATVAVKMVRGRHPQNLNTTNYLNRYWTVSTSGITNPVYDFTSRYANVTAEITGSESRMTTGVYTTSWKKLQVPDYANNVIAISGLTENVGITGINLAAPIVTINPTVATICLGSSVTLTAEASGSGTLTYSWNPGGATSEAITVNPAATTTYRVTVIDGTGETVSPPVTVTVTPISSITSVSGTTPICSGVAATYSANGVVLGGGTGAWSSSNNDIATVNSSGVVTGVSAGTSIISYIITGGCNGTVSAQQSVTVNPVITPSVSISANPGSNICAGTPVTFTASPTNGGTSPLYQWRVNGINTGAASTNNTFTSATLTNGSVVTVLLISNASPCATDSPATSNSIATTVYAIPTITGTKPASVCGTGNVTLGATASAGTINWYSASTGGSSLGTGTSYTTPSITSTTTYYVDAIDNGCTTATRTAVVATVNTIPTITGTTPGSICGTGAVTLGATASAGTINWYAAPTGGTSLGVGTSFTTPGIATTTAYYVDATDNGCTTGTRATVVATVNAIPTITGTTPGSICGTGAVTLGAIASAGIINWYAVSTGGVLLGTGTSFTTPSLSSNTTYYVDATDNGCTTATRTAVTATVNTIPTITGTTPASICGTGTVTLGATASAGTINWYAAPTGGSSLGNGTIYTTPNISSATTYYVDATSGSCTTTSRTAVTATVNTIPTITGTTPASICGTGTVTLNATASAGTINWYSVLTGGTSLGTGTNYTTSSIASTTTYYVDATDNGCTTTTRTAVTATVNAIPTITGTTPGSICGTGAVTLGATASAGTINWYAASTGGASLGTGTSFTIPSIATTTTYYVDATNSGCTTATRTAVTTTVNAVPTITGTTPGSICGTGTVTLGATASAGTVNWYAAPTGGTSLGTGTSFTTPSIASTTSYYVDATLGSCTTTARTAVVATVNAIPTISTTTPGSRCLPAGFVILGATASAGTINWYAAPTGGTSLGTGASFTTPSISLTTTYYVDATDNGCTTATRTAIVATVYAIPTITSTTPGNFCLTGTAVLGAIASVGTINWYAASTGGVPLGTGTSFTTPSISATTTYYVDATIGGCTTGSRTAVIATRYTNPVAPVFSPSAGNVNLSNGICPPVSSLIYSVAPSTNITNYNWVVPAGWNIVSGAGTNAITVDATTSVSNGNNIFSVTAQNVCGTSSPSTFTAAVSKSAGVDAGLNASICVGGTITLTGTKTGYAQNVLWTSSPATGTFSDNTSLTSTYTPAITSGTVTLTLTTTKTTGNPSCPLVSDQMILTVYPVPTAVSGTAVTTCSNSGAVNITAGSSASNYSSILWTSNGTGTIANATSLTTATYTPGAGESGTVTLTLTAIGNSSCGNAISTKSLTIISAPTAVSGTAITTCSNSGAVIITTGSSATNNLGITWTSSGTGAFTNASSLTLATYTPSPSDISAGSITLTLTATGNSPCGNATSTKSLTITPAPTVVAGTAVTTCSNAGAVNITAGSSATNYSGILWTSNGTGSLANGTSLTTATYSPGVGETGTVTLTLTASGNSPCLNAISTKNLTITASPTAVAGTAITTCSNSGAVNITSGSSATNNAGVTWTSSGTGAFTNANSLTLATYTPSPADISVGSVTLTLTATGNSPCADAISSKTLTITDAVTANAGTAIATCSNLEAVNITAGSSATNYSGILWTSNGTGTFVNENSLTTATYAPSAADILAGGVTLTFTAAGYGTCANAISTKSFTITAAPTSVAGTALTTCSNLGAVSITAGSSASNYASISWSSNGTGTIANANSLTLATYTPSTADISAGIVTLTLTATGNLPCADAISSKTLTIADAVTADVGTAVTTCSNSGAVNITEGSSAINFSGILWTSNGTGTFYNANSLTTATYAPSAADITAGSVTLTLTATGNSPCADAISSKTLTINAFPTAIAGTNVIICSNLGAVNITTGSSASNYSGILWTSDGTGTITDATSLTTANYTPGVGETGTVTLTLTASGNSPCADVISTKTLTVNEPIVITTPPAASQTVCSSFPVSFSVVATGTGLSYQWRKGTTEIPGATSSTYTISSVSVTDAAIDYNVVISASPCALVTSANADLIVNQGMEITIQPENQTLCEGLNTTFTVAATGSISSYIWRKNGIPISGGNITGENTATLAITGVLIANSGNYDVVISSIGETCDQVISNTASLMVNPRPTAVLSGTQAICNGNVASLSLAVTGTGTISGTLSDGTVFNGTAPTITVNISPTSTTTYTISTLSDVNCAALPANITGDATVTVTPMPTATISYAGSPFCTSLAGAQSVTFTGTPGGTYSSTAGLTINAATGEITSGTSTPATYTVTYTIVAAGGCPEVTATTSVTITALPAATISYAGSPYCTGLAVAQSVTRTGTTGGTYTSLPAGLMLNSATGDITPTTSTPGTYTVTYTIAASGGCSEVTTTASVTIRLIPTATISYAGSPFCTSLAGAQSVAFTGTPGGIYSSTAGLIIDASTGEITPGTSTPGIYIVTYTIVAAGGCPEVTATTSVTITSFPTATISYAGSPFCTGLAEVQAVTLTGTAGGIYSSLPAGLTLNPSTGAITPGTSTAGTYTVTYTIAASGGCAEVTTTTSVTITFLPTATISYAGSSFCANAAGTQLVTQTGTPGGTYSAPSGLTINTSTGEITPETSSTGTYTVTYTIVAAGGCEVVTATASVTITTFPTATISYAGSPYCTGLVGEQAVTLTGTTGGTFSSTAGLAINPATGAITPSTSTAETYTVTYTIAASGGCSEVTTTTSVTITLFPTATISYTGSPYCPGLSAAQPVNFTGTTGGTFSSTPAGLSLHPATGAITPSTSTPATYTITYTIAAAGGCGIVTATTTITIGDNVSPVITGCPTNINQNIDAGLCTAVVTWTEPTATDNCTASGSLVWTKSHLPGAIFTIGTTTVSYTATDASGNTATCSFNIVVRDNVLPIISCPVAPAPVPASAGICSANVTIQLVTATDNCTGITYSWTLTGATTRTGTGANASGSYNVGNTTVTFRATDAGGNFSTCSITVTVIDTQAPVITTCLPNYTHNAISGTCGYPILNNENIIKSNNIVRSDNCAVVSLTNDFNGGNEIVGSTFPVGITTVVWTARDAAGNTATCSHTVTIIDINRPVITNCPANIVVTSNVDCSALVSIPALTYTDNCPNPTLTWTMSAPNLGAGTGQIGDFTFNGGTTTVTYRVFDAQDSVATCSFNVIVNDNLPPVAVCKDITIQLDNLGHTFITEDAVNNGSSDDCGGLLTFDTNITVFNCTHVGDNNVVLTVTDVAGNSATCNAVVTVEDVTPPNAACKNITVQLDATGNVTIAEDAINNGSTDLCSPVTFNSDITSFDCTNIGNNTVVLTVTDASGNSATCFNIVTVEDNISPVITCPTPSASYNSDPGECYAALSFTATATDNCTNPVISYSTSLGVPVTFPYNFPVGTTAITARATDADGNSSTCTFNVTVIDDENPTITCPATVTDFVNSGSCVATGVGLGTIVTDDNCGIATVMNNAPASYPLGSTFVTHTVTDNSGNTATCQQEVIILDNQNPVITCPANVNVVADGSLCTASGVNLGTPTATDNCGSGSVTFNNDAPASFPIGITVVTWTATDGNGNSSTCQQRVTVTDGQDPTITCAPDVTVNADADACEATGVVLTAPTTSDNCGVASVTNNAPLAFPFGNNTVIWTVTDNAGNTATCTQIVTVEDNTPPVPDLATLPVVEGDICEITITVNPPTATDNCGIITGTTNDLLIFDAIGTYYITWTYDDGNGQTITQTQTVHISSAGPPAPVVQNLPTLRGECEVIVTVTPQAVSSCSSFISGTTTDPIFYNTQGIYTITWTYDDGNGQTTTQTQSVIVEDTQPPAITCPADVAVNVDPGECEATGVDIGVPTVSDNCSNVNVTNNAPAVFPVGTTVVTFTASDEEGNISTCAINVTVTDDELPAFTTCPADINDTSNSNCVRTINVPGPVYSDNCVGSTLTWTLSGATISNGFGVIGNMEFNNGITVVTYTIADAHGNTDDCTFNVTLTDNTAPTIANCPVFIEVSTGSGNTTCSQTATWTAPTAKDNCTPDASLVWDISHAPGSSFPVGNTTVTYTVTDANGNSATCSFNVRVIDNTPPLPKTLPNLVAQCALTITPPKTWDNCATDSIIGNTTTIFPYTTSGVSSIVWTFIDASGNVTTANQIITIIDTESPTWVTLPQQNVPVECGDNVLLDNAGIPIPGVSGIPTARDNCELKTVTYGDERVYLANCPVNFSVERTWTAEDASGNKATWVQTFTIQDNTPPQIICTDFFDQDANTIPGSELAIGISATDNCTPAGSFIFELVYERYHGLGQSAGFCPESLTRGYIARDLCGNVSDTCFQVYTFIDKEDCEACIDDPDTNEDDVPYFFVDFNGTADSTWVSPNVIRNGICCFAEGPPPPRCISFDVYLDKDAVGLIFTIPTGAVPGGALYYHINCGPPQQVGEVICLAGDNFYTITFCEPGNNTNTYAIQSISGASNTEDIVTRADEECIKQIEVTGLEAGTITWTVTYPAGADSLLNYLSCTDCTNPVFMPDSITPPTIIYEVCGRLAGTYVCDGMPIYDCAELTVTTYEHIEIGLDIDLTAICKDEIPLINAEITPTNMVYNYAWYDGPDGTGNLLSTLPSYQPTTIGAYSVVVTETSTQISCNSAMTNFNITYDLTGPIILIPPVTPLVLDCDLPVNERELLIANWLASASAYDEFVSSVPVSNDYSILTPSCNLDYKVHFWADDVCGNSTLDSAYIRIIDTTPPVISPQASNSSSDCSTSDPNANPGYLDWLANYGGAAATDGCDNDLIWTNNSAPANWSNDPANNQITVTFTVTDACGNFAETTATYSIIDDEAPTIICPEDAEEVAAINNCDKTLVTITDPVIGDNCSTPVLTYTRLFPNGITDSGNGSVTGLVFPVGVTTVTYTATDAAGNESEPCSFTVTIIDVNPPIFTLECPLADISAVADPGICGAALDIPIPVVTDFCFEQVSLANSFNGTGNASGTYPVGETIITWTAIDVSRNVTTCTQTVTVTDDQDPAITCPANAVDQVTNGGCDLVSGVVGRPSISDNCAIESLTYELTGATVRSSSTTGINYADGELYNVGLTTVTYTLTDIHGNSSTCSHTVWIQNLVAPRLTVACPVTPIEQSADANLCEANVTVPAPVITNPCNEAYTVTNDSPYKTSNTDASGTYPVGSYTFTWTVTDASGNVTTCTQIVTVTDDQDPAITCPANAVDQVTNGGCDLVSGVVGRPSISDNCDIESLTYELTGATVRSSSTTGINYADGELYNVGLTTLTYTLTDIHGNSSTCSHTVWIQNLVAPRLTVACPVTPIEQSADANLCEANITVPAPVITNPCNEAYTVTNDSPYKTSNTDASGTYPVGSYTFTWTVTDASGNVTTCTQIVTVTDDQDPAITCPANAVDQVTNGGCDLVSGVVGRPSISDNCAIESLTYELTGATVRSSSTTGINYADGELYNVGLTTVTYTLTDIHGNSSTCSHTVWIQNLVAPRLTVACPVTPIEQSADANLCEANITVPAPVITNPCNEAYTVTNDSPYKTSNTDASGIYPVGSTSFTWTIIDASGTVTICPQTVTVLDLPPTITCPTDIVEQADFELPYKDNVTVLPPTYSDNCSGLTLEWVMTGTTTGIGNTDPTGINIFPSPYRFYVGISTITYTLTDAHGHVVTCSFNVNIQAKPEITCLPPVTYDTDSGLCTATRNSGDYDLPTLVSGVRPIVWTWTITNPDGSAGPTGTYDEEITGIDGPPSIPDYPFELGESTILWRAQNISGFDECTQTVTVEDKEDPTFTPKSLTACVDMLQSVIYTTGTPNPNSGNDPNLIKDPSPDHYTFKVDNETLDLTILDDNCCDTEDLIINWRIDFSNTPDPLNPTGPSLIHPSISGTGQPSDYLDPGTGLPADIYLWGDGVNFTIVQHFITYWVEDCHRNISEQPGLITITPRPKMVKMNY